VTEVVEKGKNVWENRMLRLVIVVFIFPILVLAFHALLIVPAVIVEPFFVHFWGHPKFWAKALSIVGLLPAGWVAIVLCRRIWISVK
jgi:hypothetical protein